MTARPYRMANTRPPGTAVPGLGPQRMIAAIETKKMAKMVREPVNADLYTNRRD